MTEQPRGFLITTKTLTTFLTIVTVAGVLYKGVSDVNSYEYRLAALESNKIENENSIQNLNKEIKELTTKIVELTIALNRIDARQSLKIRNGD